MREKQDNKRELWAIAIVILIVWCSLILFLYLKTDEITRDPCSICSERHGERVFCTIGDIKPFSRTYFPNGTTQEGIKLQDVTK